MNNNVTTDDEVEIAKKFQDYFMSLFSTTRMTGVDLEKFYQTVQPTVIVAMIDKLHRQYTKEEVFKAL